MGQTLFSRLTMNVHVVHVPTKATVRRVVNTWFECIYCWQNYPFQILNLMFFPYHLRINNDLYCPPVNVQ